METSTTVGIIANPASARDIRRIVTHGAAVTTHDKLNRLRQVMSALGATGVERVVSMADRAGITAGLVRFSERPSAREWPALEFVEQPITHTVADTITATRAMVDEGVGCIVVLGGDGTNRAVAAACDDTPLVSISTGTNNAFPQPVEATVAGMAAGLVARDRRCRLAGTYRAKKLEVRAGDRVEQALVDIAISTGDVVGAGALWDVAEIAELFLCFAEPGAIGLSAIGGHLQPTSRRSPTGLALVLSPDAALEVLAPIAPGLVSAVGVQSISVLEPDSPVVGRTGSGVIAVDGERLLRFGPHSRPTITLRSDGPVVVDVAAALGYASGRGLLVSPPGAVAPEVPPERNQPDTQEPEPTEVST